MQNNFGNNLKGFTLIELLVTVAIVAIFLTISIPSSINFQNRNNLNKSAEQVQSTIYEARNYALAPRADKPPGMNYYVFWFESGGNSYKIYQAPDTTGVLSETNLVTTYYLPVNCQFADANVNAIYFSIENGGKISSPISDIVMQINSSKVVQSKTLIVNFVTGQVMIQ